VSGRACGTKSRDRFPIEECRAIAGFCEIYRGCDFQKVSALKNF
jgi:hypothetical protein